MGRSRRKRSATRRYWIPLLCFCFLAGIAAVLLLAGSPGGPPASTALAPSPAEPSATSAPSAPSDADDLARLAQVLAPVAHWEVARSGMPPRWEGSIEGEETLIHWNTRVSAAIEAAGLEVSEATEELVERRGRSPLQRLTLRVGREGRPLALVLVETARAVGLPPAF